MVHILALASIRGLIVRGPVAGRDQAFVLARDWLGAPPPAMGREAALGELARRYLTGHAPAAERDLARWAGIGLADARLGLARCGAIQRADGLAELPVNPQRAPATLPPPLLLGAFDPLLLGWASRTSSSATTGTSSQSTGCSGRSRWPGGPCATWNITRGQVRARTVQPAGRRDPGSLDPDAADVTRFWTDSGRLAALIAVADMPRPASSAHRHIPADFVRVIRPSAGRGFASDAQIESVTVDCRGRSAGP